MPAPKVGSVVAYVDEHRVEHAALVTAVWGPDCVNLVLVRPSTDPDFPNTGRSADASSVARRNASNRDAGRYFVEADELECDAEARKSNLRELMLRFPLMLLAFLLMLCGGCYGVAVSGKGGVQLDAAQLEALAKMDPRTAALVVDAMNAQVGVAGLDSVEKVERTWNLSRDPKTGLVTIGVTANHSGDAEAIRAVGEQLKALADSLGPVVQQIKTAKIVAGAIAPLIPTVVP